MKISYSDYNEWLLYFFIFKIIIKKKNTKKLIDASVESRIMQKNKSYTQNSTEKLEDKAVL